MLHPLSGRRKVCCLHSQDSCADSPQSPAYSAKGTLPQQAPEAAQVQKDAHDQQKNASCRHILPRPSSFFYFPCPCIPVKAHPGSGAEIKQSVQVKERHGPVLPKTIGHDGQGSGASDISPHHSINQGGQSHQENQLEQIPEHRIIGVVHKCVKELAPVKGDGRLSHHPGQAWQAGGRHIPYIVKKIPQKIGQEQTSYPGTPLWKELLPAKPAEKQIGGHHKKSRHRYLSQFLSQYTLYPGHLKGGLRVPHEQFPIKGMHPYHHQAEQECKPVNLVAELLFFHIISSPCPITNVRYPKRPPP